MMPQWAPCRQERKGVFARLCQVASRQKLISAGQAIMQMWTTSRKGKHLDVDLDDCAAV